MTNKMPRLGIKEYQDELEMTRKKLKADLDKLPMNIKEIK